jgi:hypothetical protein
MLQKINGVIKVDRYTGRQREYVYTRLPVYLSTYLPNAIKPMENLL